MVKKIISFIPIEIIAVLLIIAVPAIGVTVLSNKVSKNLTNHVAQSLPNPSPTVSPSPSPNADLKSITGSLLKSPNPNVLGEDTTNINPSPVIVTQQTYRILSLSELANMNGVNAQLTAAMYDAYNTFLKTPNLQYLTPAQQQEIFNPIASAAVQRLVDQQKAQLQQQLSDINQELYSLPQPSSQSNNQSSTNYQTCLNNKITVINNNPYLSESSRQLQIAKAQQDCANQ